MVIASVNGMPYLARCLDALAERCPDAEVVVADWTDEATRKAVRERRPAVKLLSFDEPMTIPELRAAGVFAAAAPVVALIEDHCLVTPGWGDRLTAAHAAGHDVAGGPIRNGATGRIRDWAAFFCEYSAVMEPLPAGPVRALPGMNVSYGPRALEAIDDLLREGRWESWLHPRLQQRGFELWCEPDAVVEHDKGFELGEFFSQRYHYSRSYAGMRNPELGAKRCSTRSARRCSCRSSTGGSREASSPVGVRARSSSSPRRSCSRTSPTWAFGEAVGYRSAAAAACSRCGR